MKINLNKFILNFLILLVLIYFSQGALYPNGHPLGKISLILIFGVSLPYIAKSLLLKNHKNITYKNTIYYSLLVLIVLNTVGFLFESKFNETSFSQFKFILTALLPFFPFYYFSLNGYLSREKVLTLFFLLLPLTILAFYNNKNNIIEDSLSLTDNVVNNIGYYFVALIPFVFLIKNRIISILSLFIIFLFIIQSSKRGAVFLAIVALIVFIIYQFTMIDRKKIIQSFVISLIGLILFIKFSIDTYESNEYLISRLQKIDEGGSGRDIIYSNLWNNWWNSNNILNYFLGFGFASTVVYSGSGYLAHNDWLELLTNFGLLGCFIYFLFFVSIVAFIFKRNFDKTSKFILICIFLISFLQTFFSMFYNSPRSVFLIILLAYVIGNYQYKKRLS